MKVDLAVLHASIKHLFPFLLYLCKKKRRKKDAPHLQFCEPMVYEMMLVKANILNDKESGNSKKDSVK